MLLIVSYCYIFNGYARSKTFSIIIISKGSLKERQVQQHKRTQRFFLRETTRGKTPQDFLNIEFDQVQVKTLRTRIISSLPRYILSLSLSCTMLECKVCPNERGASHTHIHQVSDSTNQPSHRGSLIWANLPRKTQNTIYILLLWVLLPRLTTEFLPHDFYMTNYIKNISEQRNNNPEGGIQ